MSTAPDWLPAVAAAHAAKAHTWTERGVTVRRVTGGSNNALYCVEADGQRYACKLFVADERRRAAREYRALRLLQAAGLDIAPQPLWLDESCTILPHPTVVYRWLPGAPLVPPLTTRQLAALIGSIHNVCTPSGRQTSSTLNYPTGGSTGLTSRPISTSFTASWPSTDPGWWPPIRRDATCMIGSLGW